MITIKEVRGAPKLAEVYAEPEPHSETTPFGDALDCAFSEIIGAHPSMKIIARVIMPDHAHYVIFVNETIPKPIGSYIGQAKGRVTAAIRELIGIPEATIFEPDFTDSIVFTRPRLQHLIDYVKDNPRRLLARRAHHYFFKIYNTLTLRQQEFEACGNLALLNHPDKEAVIVHRGEDETQRSNNREKWLRSSANGGILVSPFISLDEKAIMSEGIEVGARIILLTNEPIGEKFKPQGKWFDLCAEGKLLVLHPKMICSYKISRSEALALNRIAEQLCE